MGLIDNIRGFFSGSKNSETQQIDDEYEKSRLAENIVDSVNKIKRINGFDSSIWNLSNVSSYDLMKRSLDELQRLNSNLEKRLAEISHQKQNINPEREALARSAWTGQRPQNMSNYDFDRLQRDDDGAR